MSGKKSITVLQQAEPAWFKQFWPWFLIALPASVVIAAIATLIIAHDGADDLVAKDYYREGLAINRRLKMEQQAAALNVSVSLSIDTGIVTAELRAPAYPDALLVDLYHPFESTLDQRTVLRRVSTNRYEGLIPSRLTVRWDWTAQPLDQAEWRTSGVLTGELK